MSIWKTDHTYALLFCALFLIGVLCVDPGRASTQLVSGQPFTYFAFKAASPSDDNSKSSSQEDKKRKSKPTDSGGHPVVVSPS